MNSRDFLVTLRRTRVGSEITVLRGTGGWLASNSCDCYSQRVRSLFDWTYRAPVIDPVSIRFVASF